MNGCTVWLPHRPFIGFENLTEHPPRVVDRDLAGRAAVEGDQRDCAGARIAISPIIEHVDSHHCGSPVSREAEHGRCDFAELWCEWFRRRRRSRAQIEEVHPLLLDVDQPVICRMPAIAESEVVRLGERDASRNDDWIAIRGRHHRDIHHGRLSRVALRSEDREVAEPLPDTAPRRSHATAALFELSLAVTL